MSKRLLMTLLAGSLSWFAVSCASSSSTKPAAAAPSGTMASPPAVAQAAKVAPAAPITKSAAIAPTPAAVHTPTTPAAPAMTPSVAVSPAAASASALAAAPASSLAATSPWNGAGVFFYPFVLICLIFLLAALAPRLRTHHGDVATHAKQDDPDLDELVQGGHA